MNLGTHFRVDSFRLGILPIHSLCHFGTPLRLVNVVMSFPAFISLEPQKVSPRAALLPVFFQLVKLPFRTEAEASFILF